MPSEPLLLPKLRSHVADFPYPRSPAALEALHPGDLLRIAVRRARAVCRLPSCLFTGCRSLLARTRVRSSAADTTSLDKPLSVVGAALTRQADTCRASRQRRHDTRPRGLRHRPVPKDSTSICRNVDRLPFRIEALARSSGPSHPRLHAMDVEACSSSV